MENRGFLERNNGFMAAGDTYKDARLVLFGAPMDWTCSFRAGSREGPAEIRKHSYALEEYSIYLKKDLRDLQFFDAGDVVLPFGDVHESLQRIALVVNEIVTGGKLPFMLGGEHLVTLAAIRELANIYPDLVVIQFDAHADLRHEYMGLKLSHATVMRRVAEIIGERNLFQFGVRSGDREEFTTSTHLNLYKVYEPLQKALPELARRPVYVSLDIDVLDPAFAPGTGTPEPGGCAPAEIMDALHLLGGLNIVGLDLVEVCPAYDHSGITSVLAAKLVREAIFSVVYTKA